MAATPNNEANAPSSGHGLPQGLPPEILTTVTSFLTPAEMLQFAYLSKSSWEILTYHDIVYNCIKTNGGHWLHDYIRDGISTEAVPIPSKKRLLHLTNAQRCENHETCFVRGRSPLRIRLHESGFTICMLCNVRANQYMIEDTMSTNAAREIVNTDHRAFTKYHINWCIELNRPEATNPILTESVIDAIVSEEQTVDEYLHAIDTPRSQLIRHEIVMAFQEASSVLHRARVPGQVTPDFETRLTCELALVSDCWKPWLEYYIVPETTDEVVFDCRVVDKLRCTLGSIDGSGDMIDQLFANMTKAGLMDYSVAKDLDGPLGVCLYNYLAENVKLASILNDYWVAENIQSIGVSRDAALQTLILGSFLDNGNHLSACSRKIGATLRHSFAKVITFIPIKFVDFVATLLLLPTTRHGASTPTTNYDDEKRLRLFAQRVCRNTYYKRLHIDDKMAKFRTYGELLRIFVNKCFERWNDLVPKVKHYVEHVEPQASTAKDWLEFKRATRWT